MKSIIKRFWGVGLIVIIMSSLLLGAAPVSAGNYAFSADTTQPTTLNRILSNGTAATTGIFDEAQTADGTTMYAINQVSGTSTLFMSTNGGITWTPCVAAGLSGAYDMVAVAPDSASIVVVANSATQTVYLSTTSGAVFSSLGVPSYATANPLLAINDITISPASGPSRYIAVAGNYGGTGGGAVYVWTYGSAAPAWYNILAAQPTGPVVWTALTGTDNAEAVAFSSSFASDLAITVVTSINGTTGGINGAIVLHAGSFNTRKWDSAAFDSTFPRVLKSTTAAILTSARATITLDPAFYMGDTATQIGFIGAQITSNSTGTFAEVGGIFRFDYSVSGGVNVLAQIMTGTAISSVAWDGTNIVAAPYNANAGSDVATVIYRSSNALASASSVTFLPGSTFKTPTTGFEAKLAFLSGNVLCFSRGNNGGVAKSTDLGKDFNGIALLNTTLNVIRDTAVSPDGKTIYMTVNDGVDSTVWRYMNATWQRIMIIAGDTTTNWLVRSAASDPTAVLLGAKGGTTMYLATDSGEYKWTQRARTQLIQDFTVESNLIVYVVATSTNIVKSINGAFTWGTATNTQVGLYGGGTCYSVTLVAPGNLVVGGTAGGVAYSADSAVTWTAVSSVTGAGNILTSANGLATGSTIFAASSNPGATSIAKWVIGTNTAISGWTYGTALGNGANGLAYVNSVLYVLDSANGTIKRFISPLVGPFLASDSIAFTGAYNTGINALQSSIGSTVLWTHNTTPTPQTLDSYTEYLALAANAPALTFPTNGYLLQVNSLNGNPNNFVFQWASPAAVSTTVNYNYEIVVYLDAAGLIPVGGSSTTAILAAATPGATVSAPSSLAIAGTPTFVPIPGTTYYWRVRTAANSPVRSQWSTMYSFTVQPLGAAVPVIISPNNGSTIASQNPAFSWTPVTSTTQYDFQVATSPSFGTTVFTDTPATAGAVTPVTIKLNQGTQYFWRVRASLPVQGDWSAVANFIVALPTTAAAPPVVVTIAPAPTIILPTAAGITTYTLAPAAVTQIAPTYIWGIILIGAVLVIAVIVLIVRTRRSV